MTTHEDLAAVRIGERTVGPIVIERTTDGWTIIPWNEPTFKGTGFQVREFGDFPEALVYLTQLETYMMLEQHSPSCPIPIKLGELCWEDGEHLLESDFHIVGR